MAEGSNRYLAYAREIVEGVAPSGLYTKLRTTPGSGISNERTTIESDEIRDDRAIVVSRLGNNAPTLPIPVELSFKAYEELLEGALGGNFIADYDLAISVDFIVDSAIDTGDGSEWETRGVRVGDYIMITGAETGSNNGLYIVHAIGDGTAENDDRLTLRDLSGAAVTFSTASGDLIRIEGGYYGDAIDNTEISIAASASNRTLTASAAAWDKVRVGDMLYFEGFSESDNNGWKKVKIVTPNIITFIEGTTVANETKNSGITEYVTNSSILKCGLDLDTFTLEEGFNDASEYHNTNGAKVNTFSVSVTTDDKITASFDMTGQAYSGFSKTELPKDGFHAQNSDPIFDSYTGDLIITGVAECVITGMDFTIDNGLLTRYALMKQDPCSIGEGRINVTGTINAFFPDATLANIYNDEIQVGIQLRLEDLNGNGYLFGFPAVQFTSNSRSITENDVTESVDFRALGVDTEYTTMYIVKQHAEN